MFEDWFVREFTRRSGFKYYQIVKPLRITGHTYLEPLFRGKKFASPTAARLFARKNELTVVIADKTIIDDTGKLN